MKVKVNIRRATEKDHSFLAWVIFRATQSHLEKCPWPTILDEDEGGSLNFLEHLVCTGPSHWCHLSRFWIAEAEDKPIAAMSSYIPDKHGNDVLERAAFQVISELGYSELRINSILERLLALESGFPDDLPGAWGIECVAVDPEYQGLGIVDMLFEQVQQEALKEGFKRAQILCLIGNTAAEKAWKRNGFTVQGEYLNADFEALIGTPGVKRFVKELKHER
ncbi:GNAT family N-acetyltransferase [Salipaludibacillus neizhouensis]|nr:GNAT family N-acetyltransferase [Salipaludibacillus neizhouensis]